MLTIKVVCTALVVILTLYTIAEGRVRENIWDMIITFMALALWWSIGN